MIRSRRITAAAYRRAFSTFRTLNTRIGIKSPASGGEIRGYHVAS